MAMGFDADGSRVLGALLERPDALADWLAAQRHDAEMIAWERARFNTITVFLQAHGVEDAYVGDVVHAGDLSPNTRGRPRGPWCMTTLPPWLAAALPLLKELGPVAAVWRVQAVLARARAL